MLDRTDKRSKRKLLISTSVIFNLGVLAYFKYCNFFIDSFHTLFTNVGMNIDKPILNIILPVGISFYTFQTMGYTIDVYRKDIKATSSFWDFAAYVSFFPQLVAGPIERASSLLPQLKSRVVPSQTQIYDGISLIIWGLFKKIVIADNVANMVNFFFDPSNNLSDTSVALLAAYSFSIQIFCDFSGYTDIARGVAKLFGIELMLNFNRPYFARSIQEFWRRWHISLSTWLRDYLYISLGGSKSGKLMTYRNLFLTMALGGLWHGASWMFILWGVYHGTLLIIDRVTPSFKIPHIAKVVFTYHLVCFGWVLFRTPDIPTFNYWLKNLFSLQFSGIYTEYYTTLILFSLPILLKWYLEKKHIELFKQTTYWNAVSLSTQLLLITTLSSDKMREFIYFQF